MLKLGQGLTLEQSPKYPDLVSRAGSFNGIRFSISRKVITHLIHFSGHTSLKIKSFQEDLEAELSGSMRNSNLIHSVLSVSDPSNLSIFFIMETKMGGGVFL
jgi:hypothetical protein